MGPPHIHVLAETADYIATRFAELRERAALQLQTFGIQWRAAGIFTQTGVVTSYKISTTFPEGTARLQFSMNDPTMEMCFLEALIQRRGEYRLGVAPRANHERMLQLLLDTVAEKTSARTTQRAGGTAQSSI